MNLRKLENELKEIEIELLDEDNIMKLIKKIHKEKKQVNFLS